MASQAEEAAREMKQLNGDLSRWASAVAALLVSPPARPAAVCLGSVLFMCAE